MGDNMVPEDVKPLITPATKSDRKPGTKPQSQSEPKTTAKQAPEGTIIKPKLKSVKQAEIVESPLEKLKRLENAQPVEVEEPESEEEFVSSLPSYNIPTKREKTDLEEYDSPDKERQQKLQPEKDEPLPDWERLKKKPESKKDSNEIVLGRGQIPEKEDDDTLALKASQKLGTHDLEPSMKLKSFALKTQKGSEPGSQEQEPVHERREVNKGKEIEDQQEPARKEAPSGKKQEVKRPSHKGKEIPMLEDNMMPEDVQPLIKPASKTDRKPGTKPQSQGELKTMTEQLPEGTIIKPKLKSLKQAEIVESPLEKLKRLENAKPMEIEESESEEEFVSTLPTYDLPNKREKTDLEQYDTSDKEKKPKLTPEEDEPLSEWERLKRKPGSEKDPNEIVLGKGKIPAFDDHENVLKLKRRQKSPLKDEEESLLLTPFDKPKAKGERKPLEDPSLENMGKLNKQPSKQEIDVNEKEIDGPGEVTNRLETKTEPMIKIKSEDKQLQKDVEPKPKETKTSKPENAEKQPLIKDMYTPVDKPNLKKVKPDELDETPLEKLKKLENAKPIEIEDPLPDHGEMISLLPNYEIPTKGEKTKLDDFKKHEKDIGPKPKKEEEKQPAKWDMLGPKETESSEQTNMVLGRAKKSEKNGIKELELKKPQIGHEPESLPSSDLIPIGTSKDEPKMLADSPRVAAGETLQKSIPMK